MEHTTFATLALTVKLTFPLLPLSSPPAAPAPAAPPALPAPPAAPTRNPSTLYDCSQRVSLAVEAVRQEGLERADAFFEPLRVDCEGSPGLARELAGIRVAERRWQEAIALARQAIEEDPNDEYARDLLGTTLLIHGEVIEALRVWNRIGKPVLGNQLLTPARFQRARRRLDDRAAWTFARVERFDLRPSADGTMAIEAKIAQPSLVPRGWLDWTVIGRSALDDRETKIVFRSPAGPGEKCDASWRWWTNRPRLAANCSLPRAGMIPGLWRLETFWESQTFETTLGSADARTATGSYTVLVRSQRIHAGLTSTDWLTSVFRYSIGLGFDAWANRTVADHADDLGTPEQRMPHPRTISLSGGLERRSPDDRLSLSASYSTWFPLGRMSGMTPFHSVAAVIAAKSSSALRGWQYVANVGVDLESVRAPLSVWPKPGVGSELTPLLRAHPLLDRGVVAFNGTTVFGRDLLHETVEARYWMPWKAWKLGGPALLPLGLATFLDFARAGGVLDMTSVKPSSYPWQADAGAGVRLKLIGSSRLIRIDFGYGLRDRSRAVTLGPSF